MPWGSIAGAGWASGLNLYATMFGLGLAGRLGWATTPYQLQSTTMMSVVAVLYAIEFIADKVPLVDSAWDSIHTVIRPLGAAWLAGLMSGHSTWTTKPVAGFTAALLAFSSHGAKATTRAAVNTSPEPFSNIALSFSEDGLVVAMVALSLSHPRIAAVVAVVAGAACFVVAWRLVRFVRRVFRRLARTVAHTGG